MAPNEKTEEIGTKVREIGLIEMRIKVLWTVR